MNITAYFANLGVPKTGLSPTVNIRDLSTGGLVVTAGAMAEIGDGFYKYSFAGYDSTKEYSILCDSVTLAGSEQYAMTATTGIIDAQVKGQDDIDFGALQKLSLNAATPAASNMRGTDNAALAATALSTATWTSARAAKLDTIGGPGAIAYAFTVTKTGGSAVAGAEVWCTTDAAGTNVVEGVGITDANGLYTFHLDAGGYWFWAQHSGLNPASVYEVVS